MRRILMLILALLMVTTAASAEVWDLGNDLFLNQLNEDIRLNDSTQHLYSGSDIISGNYQTFYCPDDCFATVWPSENGSDIKCIELLCRDVGCVRRRMDDAAYLAYCFGGRDSVQSVSDWCDEWYTPICHSLVNERELHADPCDCPAFVADMRVYRSDDQVWWMSILLTM